MREQPQPPAITYQPALLEGPAGTTTRLRNRVPRQVEERRTDG
jgi:hypothetical protein